MNNYVTASEQARTVYKLTCAHSNPVLLSVRVYGVSYIYIHLHAKRRGAYADEQKWKISGSYSRRLNNFHDAKEIDGATAALKLSV